MLEFKQTTLQTTDLANFNLLFLQAYRNVRNHTENALKLKKFTVENWLILIALCDYQKGITLSDLGHLLGMQLSGLSKNIDRLSKRALLYRQQDIKDRRKVLLFISDFGRETLEDIEKSLLDQDNWLYRRLDREKIFQLKNLLNEL
ncbi:MAG: MarR family transcriptional regulator [Pseudomonadota bacterium]